MASSSSSTASTASTTSAESTKSKTILIDGVEYAPTSNLHVPVVGFDVNTRIVRDYTIYMSIQAFMFVSSLPGETFVSSTGYTITCYTRGSAFTSKTLRLNDDVFCGKRVDFRRLGWQFTDEQGADLELALKELAEAIRKQPLIHEGMKNLF